MEQLTTLCVIDDIASVVEGIAAMTQWHDHGIRVVGTALDGEEGLSMIRQLRPDIVLTDIRMPNMDGIEMLTQLKQEGLTPKVIFFSGYTDFNYAQQAVRLGAFDYLTKPHSIKQIVEIVVKAKERVLAERQEEAALSEIRRKVRESMPILRQEFLNLLLHHPTDLANVQRRWEFLQIDLPQNDLAVLVIEIDQFAKQSHSLQMEEVELVRFSLQNIVEETVAARTQGVVFRETMSRFVAVCHAPAAVDVGGLAEAICNHVAQYTKFTVSIGQGRTANDVTKLPNAYQEASKALSYQFYTGGNTVLSYEDVAGRGGLLPRYSKGLEQELGMSLLSGNSARAVQALEAIFEELSSCVPLPEPAYLISVYNEITSFILRILLENVPYEELRNLENASLFTGWGATVSLNALQQQMLDICKQGCKLIENRRQSETERAINEAVRYIRSALHTDLTLQDCARHVHLSPNYFANLFKKVMGVTFVQFLTQERLEAAKRMLLEGRQVQEISGDVGYEDRRYFSQLFKKYTGMTPSEFKSQYAKER
ncbi:response regulator [Cohnella thermotolerans]|uniref:response regulator n=1 Tax=Cohnella thermotolerans TaxID=329858 RepID=UPI0004795B21|nr:response regulator [Cohnella thermotolerans]